MAATKTAGLAKRKQSTGGSAKQTVKYKGLDLGTSRIVAATMSGNQAVFEEQLNAFVALPYTKMTLTTLEQEGILHHVEGDEILVFGNRADEFANIMGGTMRRPMDTGLLNPREPRNLQVIELAVRALVGPAAGDERIGYSIPSAPEGREGELTYHEEALREVLEDLGYKADSVNEGLAVVYTTLKESDFTGIGMSFGGGLCNVCVAFLGMPVLNFCTTHAGDYIDLKAASVIGETPTTVRLHKESDDFDLTGRPATAMDRALSIYYKDVIKTVVGALQRELLETKRMPKLVLPVPVVFAGGTASVKGFGPLLEDAIREARLPLEISEVKQAKGALDTTAKGSLLAAMLNM